MPREIVTLQCGDCKERNYSTTKNRKTTTERVGGNRIWKSCGEPTQNKEPTKTNGGGLRSWRDWRKWFYTDVGTEMGKVPAPLWKEFGATTAVVVITVFIFGVYFFVIDNVIQKGVNQMYSYFGK